MSNLAYMKSVILNKIYKKKILWNAKQLKDDIQLLVYNDSL